MKNVIDREKLERYRQFWSKKAVIEFGTDEEGEYFTIALKGWKTFMYRSVEEAADYMACMASGGD